MSHPEDLSFEEGDSETTQAVSFVLEPCSKNEGETAVNFSKNPLLFLWSRSRRSTLIATDVDAAAIAINVDAQGITGSDHYTQGYHTDKKEENPHSLG